MDEKRNIELVRYASSVSKQIDGELKSKNVANPGGERINSMEATSTGIVAAVQNGILTEKASEEACWLLGIAERNEELTRSDRKFLVLSEETMNRAALAEQLVSSDIAASRRVP